MAKKSKNPLKNGESNNVANSNEGSNPSTVFKTLFGEVAGEDAAANSLFSDNNPFHRKNVEIRVPNGELRLGLAEKEKKDANVGDSDVAELDQPKKRKKDKVRKESPNVDAEVVEDKIKKLKKAELKGNDKITNSNLGSDSEEVVKKDSGRFEGNGEIGAVENEKKKKKRKRDEVEAEYEARRYGATGETKEITVVGEKRKKMDNPEDTMVLKEGFDDESKLLRTVFVGNLPLKLKKKEIAKEFVKFGEVESVRIRSVPIVDGKIPRKGAVIKKQINENGNSVNAYVVFKTEEAAQASLAHNMAMVGGNHIRVDRACPPRKKLKGDPLLYDNRRTVFLGNLPFDVKDEEIYHLFSGIKNLETSVEAVRVIRDPGSSLGKGIAYVLFKTVDAANLTVKKRKLRLRDRELRVSHAKPVDTSSKRMNSSPPERSSGKKAVRTPEAKANFSYQGLHASKSGGQKKVQTRITVGSAKSKSQPAANKHVSGKKKRPAVAARKQKELHAAAANASTLAGTKRKLGNPSPGSSGGQKKKARKFR